MISKISGVSFKADSNTPAAVVVQPKNVKSKLTDKFHTGIRNNGDMTDTVSVPRTVFKGYLGFMSGSFVSVIGNSIKSHLPKTAKGLTIAGALLMIYGTYAFVRPYIFKDIKGVSK